MRVDPMVYGAYRRYKLPPAPVAKTSGRSNVKGKNKSPTTDDNSFYNAIKNLGSSANPKVIKHTVDTYCTPLLVHIFLEHTCTVSFICNTRAICNTISLYLRLFYLQESSSITGLADPPPNKKSVILPKTPLVVFTLFYILYYCT